MSELPFAVSTPIHVEKIGLKARDAVRLADFYRQVVGLDELGRDGEVIRLGAAGRELLAIESDPAATPDDPRTAGLYHTAFLLPRRADLARWLRFAAEAGLPISGASDHLVSEAVYLNDPEGNGIEIYADRPHENWKWNGDQIEMATVRLDAQGLIETLPEGDTGWQGAPENTVVGHVHLRVGDPRAAESWWHETFDFDTVARYGTQAVFLSSGGYHHHIGSNTWQSAGAGPRDPNRAGLSWVEMGGPGIADPATYRDPWGTEIRAATASA